MQIRRFSSIDEIRALPGYVEHITKIESQQPIFLGYYLAQEKQEKNQCAYTSCHRWYGRGYVVQILDGRVFAIGHICGADLFGREIWGMAARSFDKAVARHQMREALVERLRLVPLILERIDQLLYQPRGVMWHEKAVKSLTALCSAKILSKLDVRVSHLEADIYMSRARDDNDVNLGFRTTQSDSELIHELVGRFSGLGCLNRMSPRLLLVDQLRDQLHHYVGVSADSILERKRRQPFQRLIQSAPDKLLAAERRLAEAQSFFTTENLRLLAFLADSPAERARLSRITWNEVKGVAEIVRAA